MLMDMDIKEIHRKIDLIMKKLELILEDKKWAARLKMKSVVQNARAF